MLKQSLLTLGLLAMAQSALAQQPIGAGGQLQQIPPAPVPQKSVPDLRIERGETAKKPSPAGPRIRVKSLHVTGQVLFSEAELIGASGFKPDSDLNLSELRDMAAKISAYYNRRGYFVAQAYVPAQGVKDGAVTIVVVEGRYGKVALNNRTNLSDRLAHDILSGLNTGDVVTTAPLQRRLLLLSDVPGVEVQSTLVPGTAVGSSDLTVNLTPGPRVTGSLEADNAGNRYTGAYRGGGTVNFNDPTGNGDLASLRVLTSGSGLTYLRGSYQAQWRDATAGVAYSSLWYHLGEEFSSLDATGTAEIASVYGSYPLIRSRRTNLYVLVDFDDRTFQDKVGATDSVTDKKADVLGVGLAGDHQDRFGGGGASSYSFTWSAGWLDIQTAQARVQDAATARTNGQYDKLAFSLARLQNLGGPFSLYGVVRGQVASKNLDISEKMELGGAYGVRAYPEGEAYGDQGYLATLEGRMALPRWQPIPGRMQLIAFADTGQVDLVRSPWVAGSNRQTRSGGGVGFTWADNNNFLLSVSYAHRFDNTRATSGPDSSGQVWVQIAKLF